jgi:hypothetical protein
MCIAKNCAIKNNADLSMPVSFPTLNIETLDFTTKFNLAFNRISKRQTSVKSTEEKKNLKKLLIIILIFFGLFLFFFFVLITNEFSSILHFIIFIYIA